MEWKKILKAAFIPVFILAFIQIIISVVITNIYGGCIDCYMGFSIFDIWVLVYTIGFFFLIGYWSTKWYKFEFGEAVLTGIFAVFFFLIAEIPMTMVYMANPYSFYSRPSADLISSLYGALDEIAINAPQSFFNPTICGTILFIAVLVGAIVADTAKKSSAKTTKQPTDFGKIMSAATVPTIITVIVAIIGTVLGSLLVEYLLSAFVPLDYDTMFGLGIFAIQCLIIVWAGYRAVKKYQLNLVSAVLTGMIISIITFTIQFIIDIIMAVTGTMNWRFSSSPVDILVSLLITFMTLVVPGVVIGTIMSLIGGFAAQKTWGEPAATKPKQS
jgi:hypothetical protein